MTTKTQTGSPITLITAEDSQAPALRNAGVQTTNAAGVPVYDDRTPYLDLPLPHADNELEDDVFRVREAFAALDAAHAGEREERKNADASLSEALAGEEQAREEAVLAEKQTREQADSALESAVQEEAQLRTQADAELAASLEAEAAARAASDATEALARAEHDAAAAAHAALIKRVTMGDLSPVIGVALVENGSGSGLWCHVDAEGHIITPPKRYFDFHPTFSALTDRVLVDGQVMQRHKKFYYKTLTLPSGELAGKHARLIAPEKLDGFKPHPAFVKNGVELDHWYCGTYSATDDGGKLGSRPGRMPFVNVNYPTMQQLCRNRNAGGVSGFDMWNIWQVGEIQLLFLIEYACTDSQGILGRGRVDTTAANYVDADDVAQASYRGHVGLWGNVWAMATGVEVAASGTVRLWNVDGSQVYVDTGFVLPAYDAAHMAYCKTLKMGQGAGWDFDALFLPETSTLNLMEGTVPDGFWGRYGAAGNVLYLGGNWAWGSGAGLFCQDWIEVQSVASTNLGCRLAKA